MKTTECRQANIPFQLGKCYATPTTLEEFPRDVVMSEYDILANNDALIQGGRILSSYNIRGDKLWIITDAEREATTICLPEEY